MPGAGRALWDQTSSLWGSGRGIRSVQFSGRTKRRGEKGRNAKPQTKADKSRRAM